jgi:uncharacterized protein
MAKDGDKYTDRGDCPRDGITRRGVLLSGAAVVAGGAAAGQPSSPPSRPAGENLTIPENTLGKTGVRVTRLAMGAGYPSYYARLLEHAYRNGVHLFANAYGYGEGGQERILGQWMRDSKRRSKVFVITNDGLTSPELFYQKVVRAGQDLQMDTIDMVFIHGLEDPSVVLDTDANWGRLKDRLVREKRIRFMGFSTHAEMPARVACLNAAAKSGWVDAVMVACDPLLLRTNSELNRAIDACRKANVGLIAMKTTRGLGLKAAERRGLKEGEAQTETMPGFERLGLSAFGAIHCAMWSDGRFAAICSAMLTRATIDENTRNAREFVKPFTEEQWRLLEAGMKKLARRTCPGCDGSCRQAAGSKTDFCSIARYLAYYREDGSREMARRLYAQLSPEKRDWYGADLERASGACSAGLDLPAILEEARRLLG